jgi:hypothetical protein
MDRLTNRTLHDAPQDARTLLADLVQFSPTGAPLHLHAQMANSPALLHAYVALRRAIDEHATLAPPMRAALMLATASALPNAYVQNVTATLAARAGWNPGQVAAIRAGRGVGDQHTDALLEVVLRAAADHGHVGDEAWTLALEAGWGEDQLAEAYSFLGLTVFTGHFLNFAQTSLDLPGDAPAHAEATSGA